MLPLPAADAKTLADRCMKMKYQTISFPVNFADLLDGGLYHLPDLHFGTSNIYLQIAFSDNAFVKLPTERGIGYHAAYLWGSEQAAQPIRRPEGFENGRRFEEGIRAYKEFTWVIENRIALEVNNSDESEIKQIVHYLMVHKLHYERLQKEKTLSVPESRFVFFRKECQRWFGLARPRITIVPGIVQESISGVPLWGMYDSGIGGVISRWQPSLPSISGKLQPLLGPDKVNYLDWNPKNFIYIEPDDQLYYVDSKPTTFAGQKENDHNLVGIRTFFQV